MKNRTDIQALRGFAVLVVVLYHTRLGILPAGYLGVDIFFVISGFLITGMVRTGIERGDFRFTEFYFRRAKRLLPAAYVTFLVTALLALVMLSRTELSDFALQMIGAVTFTGNIVLWQQTGYFEGAGELKPLLHVWTLAIEEQYYLLLPVTLVLVSPRRWLLLALTILVVSLALCLIGGYLKPIATFYLLPTRAWELAIGSVGALVAADGRLHRLAHLLFAPGLAVLLAIPFFPIGGNHPGLDALIVCGATLVVILRCHPILNFNALVRMFARVGDFSYSLYLVHWPIFAFANNCWAGNPPGTLPIEVRLLALTLSLILGYLLFRHVEQPVRKAKFRPSGRLLAKTIGASLGLILIPVGGLHATPGGVDFAYIRRANYGFDKACAYPSQFKPKPECRNSDEPSILVWGDSFAMHLVPGIAATSGSLGVIQATRSECGPFLDLAPMTLAAMARSGTTLNRSWAESCISFNQSVMDYLAIAPSVEIVVLSSPFRPYLEPSEHLNLQREGDEFKVVDASIDRALASLERTANKIRSLGKRVIVIAPPPSGGFDVGACLERLVEGKVLFGAPSDCEVRLADYRKAEMRELEFLGRLPGEAGVDVISFDPILCGSTSCKTILDGIFIYRDAGHLSYDGSRLLARRMELVSVMKQLAR